MFFRLSRWFECRKHDFGRGKILNLQVEGLFLFRHCNELLRSTRPAKQSKHDF